MQLWSAQSQLATHFCPTAHPGQVPPPQSMSVSAPSATPFVHVTRGGDESTTGCDESVAASGTGSGGGVWPTGEPLDSSSSEPVAHAGASSPKIKATPFQRMGPELSAG